MKPRPRPRWALVLILFCCAPAGAAPREPFGFDELSALVERSRIASVEDLLPALPAAFRANYSLIFASRSPNPSGHLDPRVILFAPGSGTFIGFNSGERGSAADVVEVIDYDARANRFRFNGFDFAGGRARRLGGEETARCLRCHSHDGTRAGAHPIWDTYPVWPGAYGSISDPTFDQKSSLSKIDGHHRRFVESAFDHPRYRQLDPLDRGSNELAFDNMRLGDEVARAVQRRVAISIVGAPGFDAYGPAFKSLPLGLEAYFLENAGLSSSDLESYRERYARTLSHVRERSERYYRSKHRRFERLSGTGLKAHAANGFHNFDQHGHFRYARLEFLMDRLGLPIAALDTSLELRTYAWVQGRVSLVDLFERIRKQRCRRALSGTESGSK